ncbi:MAG: hypothetical protein JJE28_01040 [Actinomycetales bacterium]|nr:hypothetical protein [Actinomycetales bacterium]
MNSSVEPGVLRDSAVTVRWTRRSVLWTVVLGIMSAFQLWRGAYTDGVLFGLLVGMLVVDTTTGGRIRILSGPVVAPRWIVLAITVPLGVVLVMAPRHSFIDWLAVVAVGVTVLVMAWGLTPVEAPADKLPLRKSALLWSVLGVGFCVWEALAFVVGTVNGDAFDNYPTVSVIMDPVLESGVGRTIFVALWLGAGLVLTRLWRRK